MRCINSKGSLGSLGLIGPNKYSVPLSIAKLLKCPPQLEAIELRAADRWHKELGRVGESVFAVLRGAHFKTHRRCRGKVSVV